MTIAEKLLAVDANTKRVEALNAELEQSLYSTDTGGKSYYDEFWDTVTSNGTRKSYKFAFADWNCEYIRPNRKIMPTSAGFQNMFAGNKSLKKIEKVFFDLSNHPANTENASYMFFNCTSLLIIEDIGMPSMSYLEGTFQSCISMHTLEVLRCSESTKYANPFLNCWALENLKIEGVIAQNGFSTQNRSKLSKASIESIINALSTTTSGLSVTLSATAVNNAFTTDEWNALANTKTNWTISLM